MLLTDYIFLPVKTLSNPLESWTHQPQPIFVNAECRKCREIVALKEGMKQEEGEDVQTCMGTI